MPYRAITARTPLTRDPLNAIVQRVLKANGDTQRRMASYPTQLPTSSGYVRTGTLGREWKTSVNRSAGQISAATFNDTPYGPYVQGDLQTDEMARRNWQTIGEVVDPIYNALLTDLDRIMRDHIV